MRIGVADLACDLSSVGKDVEGMYAVEDREGVDREDVEKN